VGRPWLRWEDITNNPLLLLNSKDGKGQQMKRTLGGKLLKGLMQAVMPMQKKKQRMRNRKKRTTRRKRGEGEKGGRGERRRRGDRRGRSRSRSRVGGRKGWRGGMRR
jgi:hypothetical protein